jgi:hypothetical protein
VHTVESLNSICGINQPAYFDGVLKIG